MARSSQRRRPSVDHALRHTFRALTTLAFGYVVASVPAEAQGPSTSVPGIKRPEGLALQGVTVVDVVDGKLLRDQTVLVVGNRITTIAPQGKVTAPKGALVVDAKGKYVVPGFWDMHPHTEAPGNPNIALQDSLYRAIYPRYIAHGVTGLREMAQRFPDGADSFRVWQKQVMDGERVGPRAVGPSADLTYNIEINDEDDAARVMDSLKAAGTVFIKFHDSMMQDHDLYFAILRQARRVGIPVVGHVPRSMPNHMASDSGMYSVEHIEENAECWPGWPAELLGDSVEAEKRCKPMVDAYVKNGTWMMVGLNGHWLDDQYRPDKTEGLWEDEKRFLRMLKHLGMKNFITGTDWAQMFVSWDERFRAGLSAVEDLVTYGIDAGFSPLEALQTGTLNPAKSLKATDSLGTVQEGKLADLVLLNGNPLENIRNALNVYAVVANGRFFDRATLNSFDPVGTQPNAGLIGAREGNGPPRTKNGP